MSKIGTWSTTAGSNNTTPPDGWPEGQLPSTVNDCAREMMAQIKTYAADAQWFDHAMTPTYVNANSFTVTGDQTSILEAGRRVKLYDATTIYRTIAAVSFTAVTTVSLDTGTAISSSLSSFGVAVISQSNPALPASISFSTISTLTLGATVAIANIGNINSLSSVNVNCATITANIGTINSVGCVNVVSSGFIWGKNGSTAIPSIVMDTTDQDTGFYWVSDGIIGFATNATQGARLSAGGFVSAAFTVSDERLKDNWQELPPDFIARLACLKSGTFDQKGRVGRQIGVGAQSLRDLMPEAVSEGCDGYLAVQYGNAALASCSRLAQEILELRSEIAELKEKVK